MKRKASRAAPYQPPSKLTKQSTSTTISRNLSTLRRSNTSLPATMAPPKWPSFRVKATTSRGQPDASTTLPLPKWPTLVPTGRAKKASAASSAVLSAVEEDVTEVSEEMEVIAPGLRRMSTLQLEDEDKEVDSAGRKSSSLSKASAKSLSKTSSKSLSRAGSKSLSKRGSTSMSRSASKSLSRTSSKSLTKARSLSSASKASAVATLEKNGSVVTLDTEGNVTTVTPLASGSSVVETTALFSAPPSIRKELSKKSDGAATTKAHLVKKLSSIRVFGTDAPEEDDEERDEDGAAKKTPVKGKAKTTVSKTGALAKGKGKVTAAKTKGKATAAKTKGKVAAAKTKGKVTAAKTKGKVTAAKTKGKVTAAKTKGKVTAAKTKGKVTAAVAGGKGRSKATASKGKTKTTKANVKAGAKAAALKAKGRGVKVVKGRKPDKSKGKKVTATKSKQRKKPVPGVTKKFREDVKDEELSKGSCVKKIEWTPWYKALVPANPPLRGKQSWDFMPRSRSRPRGPPPRKIGLRNVRLFWDKQYAPAVYEVAVQMKAKKRYVVYFRACASWKKHAFWDTILLNSGAVNHEVKAVLQAGGQIWLRRGNVLDEAALKEAKKHINKYYDYAWHKRKAARATGRAHRRVKKCNTLISGN
ncbi:coiled-coil domain-containing protein 71-like [Littorina saxatilis]|uniref:coiled-coil domain-containing protein 71-like n=1 Tax=Littorina saxatilis TaxID=31220 RepID=UPI0038B4B840